FRKAFTYQFCPVVQPGGEYGGLFIRMVVFQKPIDGRIVIIRGFYAVAPYIVFVYPGPGEKTVISYRRNGWCFGISSLFSAYICPGVPSAFGDRVQMRSRVIFYHICREPVYDDKDNFSRFFTL